jgi:mono/diheme cytochrome c family protein
MGKCWTLTAAILISLVASGGDAAERSRREYRGNADAGREFALRVCTGCHVVSPDQPFAPDLKGKPDFHTIANRLGVTAESLRRKLAALPQVPAHGQMANPQISEVDRADVVAYIMSLREKQ